MAWPPAPPAATTPIDIANHVKRSASPVRSGLKPYIREQLHHRDQGSRLPDNPSVAAHFIPHKEVYDVAFISLRHMVFKVDGKSATPISHILHGSVVAKGGGSGEICGLIEDLCPPGRRRTTWFEQSEEVKLRWPKYARFRGMIEDARKQHAIRLRDAGMVDVDVLFAGFESGVAIYKRDQEIINKTGGKIYHLWPLDQRKRTSRMSALIKAETLNELYPPERRSNGLVTIMVNTHPAEVVVPPTPELTGGMFSYSQPLFGGRGILDFTKRSPEECRAITNDEIESIIARHRTENGASGSNALFTTQAVPHRSWNFNTLKVDQSPTRWSVHDEPFSYLIDSENNAFWKRDLSIRTAMLEKWHQATWKDTGEVDNHGKPIWGRVMSAKPPDEAKANIDFDVLPGLCEVYPANRNYEYHEKAIAPVDRKEDEGRVRRAEARYQYCYNRTKKHEAYMERMAWESAKPPNYQNAGFQAMLKMTIRNQFMLDQELRDSMAYVVQLRRETGIYLQRVAEGLDVDGDESRLEQESVQLSHPSHDKPKLSQPSRIRQASKLAKPALATLPEEHVIYEDDTSNGLQTEPFPKYEEPIATQSADQEGYGEEEQSEHENKKGPTEQHSLQHHSRNKIEELKREAATRKTNGKSIADILHETGVVRGTEHHDPLPAKRSASCTSIETALRVRPPTPVTPNDSPQAFDRASSNSKDKYANGEGNPNPTSINEEGVGAVG